jgi:NAD(P)-dependent dehydrogenase (short-subunit alcohol dehydrogenase family)
MSGMLAGKVAIVTGGTSGIGAATAQLFVAEGAKVVIAARRQEEGDALVSRLGSAASFRKTDVSDEDQVAALVRQCVDNHGRIDCMFNNAGNPGRVCGITETRVADLDDMLAVHLRGVMLGMKHAAPVMLAQGSGSVINTASLAGSRPGYSSHTYSAAKAAIIHLSHCVAVELSEGGVRVNSLSPGCKKTGMFDANAEQTSARFANLQATHHAGLPQDVANAALFLASDASAFITGKDVIVDGGNVGGWKWPDIMAQWEEARRLRWQNQRAVSRKIRPRLR